MPLKVEPVAGHDTGALRRGAAVQLRSLKALVVRDMMMRYGRANIGFLWVVLEPMLLTAGVMGLWSAVKAPYEHGVQIIALVLTGYMPLTLFRHMTGGAVFMFRRNISLLYHRHLSLLDVLLARSILEFTGTTIALLFVYGWLVAAGLLAPVADPGLVLLAWLCLTLVCFGLATIFSVMTEYSEVTERFIQPFQYLLVPLSGTFFMVDWLPKRAQDLIVYNPLVHCFEMFRAGFFGDSVTTFYTVWYPVVWGLCMTAFGFATLERIRDSLQTS